MLVSALSHRTGHREVKWLAGRDCGVAVVCALERRGIKCGSTTDEREAGVMDGPGEWAFSILPIPWQIGRLAVLRRRFKSAFRRPGLDPAMFATELGILAIEGFEDMKEQARDTMIRDKFIAGQRQCALRRQLDGFQYTWVKITHKHFYIYMLQGPTHILK